MLEVLITSQGLLWLVVLALLLVVIALVRQIGLLHERLAPLGGLVIDGGPAVGAVAPRFELPTLDGAMASIGPPPEGYAASLLLFVTAGCPVCRKIVPLAKSLASAERLTLTLIGTGETQALRNVFRSVRADSIPFINAVEPGIAFGIARLPYAVLIGVDGRIAAKGLVNSREHLESLLVALQSGYGSLQDYVADRMRDPSAGGSNKTGTPTSDDVVENLARRLSSETSRRSLLSLIGALLLQPATIPLLPVARPALAAPPPQTDFARNAQTADPTRCNYWRYCGSDGFLCACCGGGPHTCPPGTSPSPTAWIGTCSNPDDQRDYLIAYRDCCGKPSCGRCKCSGAVGDTPSYRSEGSGDIVWCFGSASMQYHCSTAALLGRAG